MPGNVAVITFEEVRALKDDAGTLLIDVREPAELQSSGVIPSSINIPVGQVENALKNMSDEEFKEKYGRDKPKRDFPLVFHCLAGKRGAAACATALNLGYSNVRNYAGAWSEWAKKINE